jgi:phage terminase large subunit
MPRAARSVLKPDADTGFRPRPLQDGLHSQLSGFNVLVAHRRFGKTVYCVNELIDGAIKSTLPKPRFAYIAPFHNQAKDIAWEYLKQYAGQVSGTTFHEQELRADLPNKARIRLYGADNPDRLRGIYLDGVVLDEYAQMSPRVWSEVVRPALVDRKGWAIFIGTPMGRNSFADLYDEAKSGKDPDWRAFMFKASETGIIPAAELQAAARAMSVDQYAQEFECSFDAAIPGAYYAQLITQLEQLGRLKPIPWEPQLPVHTGWDLGVGDSTVIWFAQVVHGEPRLIDCYAASGVGLDHYIAQLRAGHRAQWIYGMHFFPHDIAVRELGTGMSRVDVLRGFGLSPTVLPQSGVDDGISQVRYLMRKLWINSERCAEGIRALRQYRAEWDDKRQALKLVPLHDWTSDFADSLRYLSIGLGRHFLDRQPLVDTALSQVAREQQRRASQAKAGGGKRPYGW